MSLLKLTLIRLPMMARPRGEARDARLQECLKPQDAENVTTT
jgi:hypothetical protein